MSWEKRSFGDVIEFNPTVKLKKGEVYDFVPMANIDPEIKFVSEIEKKEYKAGGAKFKNGDTLFARITPCLEHGKIVKAKDLISEGFGSTEYFVFRAIENISDEDFIYYLAKSEIITQPAIKSMVGASGRQRADKTVVSEIKINLPPLPTQKKIASILSAYDDLIENNLKRIKLLEEAAQRIYKEWFVDFKFPGHENAVFDKETGLPEGWEKKMLSSVCNKISSGGTPKRNKKEFWNNGKIPWIKTKELKDSYVINNEEYITEDGLKNSSAKLFEKNSIVMAIYASPTLGRLGILSKNSAFNQAMVGFNINQALITKEFLFFNLIAERKNLNNKAIGAAQQNINVTKVKEHEIVYPNFNLIENYSSKTKSSFRLIKKLSIQNQNLKEARDLLLPRLMNRTLEV